MQLMSFPYLRMESHRTFARVCCQGGLMDNAFEWIEKHGLCTEESYPYTSGTGVTGTCKTGGSRCTPAVTLTGFHDVPKKDEDALKNAVAQQPVSIAIEADKSAFQLYKGGVLDNPACGTQLDHGVLIVGYGTDSASSKDFWKVKNSWGPSWGEEGYIRMVRGKNQCGLATQPSFPTGAKPSPPRPPAPPPPPPHYEDPHKKNCLPDENVLSVEGVPGEWCAPKCIYFLKPCPKNVPAGVTATPWCAIKSANVTGTSCALLCTPGDSSCGPTAQCHARPDLNGKGICTYTD